MLAVDIHWPGSVLQEANLDGSISLPHLPSFAIAHDVYASPSFRSPSFRSPSFHSPTPLAIALDVYASPSFRSPPLLCYCPRCICIPFLPLTPFPSHTLCIGGPSRTLSWGIEYLISCHSSSGRQTMLEDLTTGSVSGEQEWVAFWVKTLLQT